MAASPAPAGPPVWAPLPLPPPPTFSTVANEYQVCKATQWDNVTADGVEHKDKLVSTVTCVQYRCCLQSAACRQLVSMRYPALRKFPANMPLRKPPATSSPLASSSAQHCAAVDGGITTTRMAPPSVQMVSSPDWCAGRLAVVASRCALRRPHPAPAPATSAPPPRPPRVLPLPAPGLIVVLIPRQTSPLTPTAHHPPTTAHYVATIAATIVCPQTAFALLASPGWFFALAPQPEPLAARPVRSRSRA